MSIERWTDPGMNAEERAKADSETSKIEELAKACDWDFYCMMGIKVDEHGQFHVSTHAKGAPDHIAVMIGTLVKQANSAALSQGVADGSVVTGQEPEHIV